MKKMLILSLGLYLFTNMLYAQIDHKGPRGPHKHKHHPKLSKEAKDELYTYDKEKIYPVKKAAHDKFLKSLSSEDLAFLDMKRKEDRALQDENHETHKKIRALKESGMTKEQMHEKMKESFAPMKEKRKTFMESMKPFMERNKNLLMPIMESLKEPHQKWKADKKAIIDKYLTDEQKEKIDLKKEAHKETRAKLPERGPKHKMHKKHMGAIKFVLWDGEMKKIKDCSTKGKTCTKEISGNTTNDSKDTAPSFDDINYNSSLLNITNYPNPAISQTTIIFELKGITKKVKIIIRNVEGKEIWKKKYSKLDAGEHKIDVDLHKFNNGQYFYTIEANDEQITKSMIVNK
ncbi:MAG: T9SS type A sorting domain-containing protein [Saprospiraceae bacterium]|nr:T9SS type A sorting domain-containing protein [Saprospiraceae bacterium]